MHSLKMLRPKSGDSGKISRGMQRRVKQNRKVAIQRNGQLQGWPKQSHSSQAGGEALNADVMLQGNYPWDDNAGDGFCELLWFKHDLVAGKPTWSIEQQPLLNLQAAKVMSLFSH